METPRVDHEAVAATYELIRPHMCRTPVVEVDAADFSHRGRWFSSWSCSSTLDRSSRVARWRVCCRSRVPRAGVVAVSGGNHGLAVAFAARKLNVPLRIFVPSISGR
jgi:threonine dehydratase